MKNFELKMSYIAKLILEEQLRVNTDINNVYIKKTHVYFANRR